MPGDSWWYKQIVVSLVEDADLDMQNNTGDENQLGGDLAIGKNGGYVPKHQILMPLVSVPFYKLFKSNGLLLFNFLMLLTLFWLVFRLNCLFIDQIPALFTTLMYASGTLFLKYSYNYSPDIFSTLLIVYGLYLCLTNHHNLGALLLGLSIFAKISNLPLVCIITIYVILEILVFNKDKELESKKKFFKVTSFIFILVISVMPFLETNRALYGSPFETGYNRTLLEVTEAPGYVLLDHFDEFNVPFLKGVNNLLMTPQKGLITTNPVIITAFLGLFFLSELKAKQPFILFGTIALAQFVIFSKYDCWYFSHYSNRFLMTFVVMMSMFSGLFIQYLFKYFFEKKLL